MGKASAKQEFGDFFRAATGESPFLFQSAFAANLQPLVSVPTGLGKTAMIVVAWLWRRFGGQDDNMHTTPRRLVYCLPMRVLVEQTRKSAEKWITNLRDAGLLTTAVPVQVLMGGEDEDDWDIHPEREAIIIGTQDMLLSRALNRGYAASRARWPMQFGLLHTDCLWVFDEIQLMGPGLATTTQLEAFRNLLGSKDGHGCRSVWMSATLERKWLETVDFKGRVELLPALGLTKEDHAHAEVKKRWDATKPLHKTNAAVGDAEALATEIRKAHNPGTRTIVVVNTVRRACDLLAKLNEPTDARGVKAKSKKEKKGTPEDGAAVPTADAPRLVLLHSRFRPGDRAARVNEALADPTGAGTIVVSTQVIEAGVDISATTLFTEVAPWASLVQRFGRCNRRGADNANAGVHWIGLPANDTDAEKVKAPYEPDDLTVAAKQLKKLDDVGIKSLPAVPLQYKHTHVIRKKDLIDLFDTTPDLAGNDIDIDRFIRDTDETDVRVFWRHWQRPKGFEAPPEDGPAPRREELCPAPVSDFRDYAKKHRGKVWRWDFLGNKWEPADASKIAPGQVFLVHADAGGYTPERGWDPKDTDRVEPIAGPTTKDNATPDANDSDPYCRIGVWQTIAAHTDDVCKELDGILGALHEPEAAALRVAARWHDWGKAHPVFQRALPGDAPSLSELWAKAAGTWKRYERRHFRHELASALAVLNPTNKAIPDELRDLVAYLIAAHHGKVRLSIRSLPNEQRPHTNSPPHPQKRFARGIWDGDALPATDLGMEHGVGVITPAVTLSLEPMELGLCEKEPFKDQPSWLERTIGLRDTLGVFRLAHLEAILRAADMRASAAAERGANRG